jgi:hypothetical protein
MTTNIGLVPAIQDLQTKIMQTAADVAKTVDTVNGLTGPNGMKVPNIASLQKLLGSLPTGISTIQNVVETFSNQGMPNLSGINGLGDFINSAIGTAQNVVGQVQGVVGAAAALGINVEALGGLSSAIAGVSTSVGTAGSNKFPLTPRFDWEIETTTAGVTFPSDLGDNFPKIQFSIAAYEKGKVTQAASYRPEYSVFLPMPKDLNESYQLNWSAYSPGPIRAIANEIAKTIENVSDGSVNPLQKAWDDLTKGSAAALESARNAPDNEKVAAIAGAGVLGLYATGRMGTSEYNLLTNFAGRTVNPYTTVAFNGPMLRQHSFSWFFAPKTPDESQTVLKILNIFRKTALPKPMQGAFLEYPKVVNIKFHPKEDKLYNFKRCVITSLNINHSGSGQLSFFNQTGLPTVYFLQMSLQEIELYTSDDVGKSSNETDKLDTWDLANVLNITGGDNVEDIWGFK